MPKASVSTPFNARQNGAVVHIEKGEQQLSQTAYAYAAAHGYLAKPKPASKPQAAPTTRHP